MKVEGRRVVNMERREWSTGTHVREAERLVDPLASCFVLPMDPLWYSDTE